MSEHGYESIEATCPFCKNSGPTQVSTVAGNTAWIACGVMCIFGLWLCCCIPCCIPCLRETVHKCSSCGHNLEELASIQIALNEGVVISTVIDHTKPEDNHIPRPLS
jgi:hypothetical protein